MPAAAEAPLRAWLIVLLPGMAALELLGAWLVWRAVRDAATPASAAAGVAMLAAYAVLASFAATGFGRTFAAYGGVFIAASLLWGWAFDGLRPDLRDGAGLALCLAGAFVIAARG